VHTHHHVILRYDREAFAGANRDAFARALLAEGVPCSGGYPEPLYASPLFTEQRFFKGRCPVNCSRVGRPIDFRKLAQRCPNAERAARQEAVWLPHRLFLGERGDVDDVVYAIHKLQDHADELAEDEEGSS